jgi:hypothetical protein
MQITARNMKRDELFWSNNEAKGLPLHNSGRASKKNARASPRTTQLNIIHGGSFIVE